MSGAGEDNRPAIDPRHDAIYQRGYRPGDSQPPPRRHRIEAPAAAVESEPVGEPEAATVSAGGSAEVLTALEALAFDTDVFQDELPRSAWNPFITALWALAGLFIVASTVLQWQAATATFANYSYSGTGPMPFGMIIQQLSYSVSPSIQTSGLLIVGGLLFWHAAAWRARRFRRPDGS